MKEKIAGYNQKLDNIQLVLDKLLTKQNASVFDKLCNMCNELFKNVCDYNASELQSEDIRSIIELLQRLLSVCKKLSDYRDYLVEVVSANINELKEEEAKREETNDQVLKLENQELRSAA